MAQTIVGCYRALIPLVSLDGHSDYAKLPLREYLEVRLTDMEVREIGEGLSSVTKLLKNNTNPL